MCGFVGGGMKNRRNLELEKIFMAEPYSMRFFGFLFYSFLEPTTIFQTLREQLSHSSSHITSILNIYLFFMHGYSLQPKSCCSLPHNKFNAGLDAVARAKITSR